MRTIPPIAAPDLAPSLSRLWERSASSILAIESTLDPAAGSPVFTKEGIWTSRGWTEWTQGFQYGSALLQFDATGDAAFLEIGRRNTVGRMAPHLSHMGVHDHGFNNVSTYGNLLRLMNEGRIPDSTWERDFYELALKVSGAVQARRWTRIEGGGGFIHSFNGPHSLFVDTLRSLRSLAVAHELGQVLLEEADARVSLLGRLVAHAEATAAWSVYYGEGRDAWDLPGRVAHESIFDVVDGKYRCPNSQQGWSGLTTWTRGLAWAILGFAEELEYLGSLVAEELAPFGGREAILGRLLRAALVTADFYLDNSASDGIPYWDTGAPGLAALGDWRSRPADPFNEHEPVDSSAAAIACQGFLRLGAWLSRAESAPTLADRASRAGGYTRAGLAILRALLDEPYLSPGGRHQGLLLHSVYHQPRGWDHIPPGRKVPCGESSMWGDYHLREAALYAGRLASGLEPPVYWPPRGTAS